MTNYKTRTPKAKKKRKRNEIHEFYSLYLLTDPHTHSRAYENYLKNKYYYCIYFTISALTLFYISYFCLSRLLRITSKTFTFLVNSFRLNILYILLSIIFLSFFGEFSFIKTLAIFVEILFSF